MRNTRFLQQAFLLASTGLALSAAWPAEAVDQDARIETAALGSHAFQTELRNDPIRVVSRNGAVTLTGVVAYPYHSFLAEATLAGLPGVTRVTNRLLLLADLTAEGAGPAPIQ